MNFNDYRLIKKSTLSDIASAVKAMSGKSSITPAQFAEEINGNYNARLLKVLSNGWNGTLTKDDLKGLTELYRCNIRDLKKVELPDSLTEITGACFSGNKTLTEVVLNANLKEMHDYAFEYCTALKSVTSPSSVKLTSIAPYMFQGCITLEEVDIAADFEEIGSGTFYECTSLKEIPSCFRNAKSIGDGAFCGCTSLVGSVHSGDDIWLDLYSAEKIGITAFSDCTEITHVMFGSNLTEIFQSAFSNCTALKNVNIHSGVVETIHSYAFHGCDSLRSIFFNKDCSAVPTLEDTNAFPESTNIWVPKALYEEWKAAPVWCDIADRIIVSGG